ncbi:MAG: AraC family transcriptional regulator [Anaerolineae bacterium]|nr:AraC family transcriptional regulator [Anaerolineae bacterium]
MDVTKRQPTKRETQRTQANREELVERIMRAAREDGGVQPLPGLHLHRVSAPRGPLHGVTKPAFCVIAQGSKEILLGESRYRYDPLHYLLATVELPSTSHIREASPERPYLSLRLELTPAIADTVMVANDHIVRSSQVDMSAINVCPLDVDLLDAIVRLIRLLDCPTEAPVLMPLITQEIIYRLLMGEQGGRLRHLAMMNGNTSHIATAIKRLRQGFDQPLRIEQVARDLGMSVSSFHHHFKSVTAMSPLQFQKRLRLQEARRLMLGEALDAASAAFRVGYHDASHFNREYKSLFGTPPMRDVQRLREAASDYAV